MLSRIHSIVFALALVSALAGCGSNGSSGPAPSPCTSAMMPSTAHLTVSGFSRCSCFDGTFTLTKEGDVQSPTGDVWSSMPITGCPGQTTTAYLKFSNDPNDFGLGITDQGSDPGSGNSDFAPVTGDTCSPFHVSGGASTAGNITAFCPGTPEDFDMTWSITN
jgi:hypothetical protein